MLKNKYFIAILILVAIGFLGLEITQWKKRIAIEKEIQSLNEESKKINEKNEELSNSIAYLQTNAAKEKIMRQQLNMKKDGEIAINFTEQAESGAVEKNMNSQIEKESNIYKWWDYFFGEK